MKRIVAYTVVGLVVWLTLTATWAAAAHVTGLPGPGKAAASSLRFSASAITAGDLPGPLGATQRVAAKRLRGSARVAERFYRGPERAVAAWLDRMGHRHRHPGAAHVVELRSRAAPPVRIRLEGLALDRERLEQYNLELRERLESRRSEVEEGRRRVDRLKDVIRRRIERKLREKLDPESDAWVEVQERLDEIRFEFAFPEIEIPEIEIPEIEVQVDADGSTRVIRIHN